MAILSIKLISVSLLYYNIGRRIILQPRIKVKNNVCQIETQLGIKVKTVVKYTKTDVRSKIIIILI